MSNSNPERYWWLPNVPVPSDPDYYWFLSLVLPIVVALLGEIMGVVALIRNAVAYAIGLALLLAPPLFYGTYVTTVLTVFVVTPSAEALKASHGFTQSADRALADAIVARDAAKVASLAPAAHLNEVGWNSMTFMHLALTDGGADPGVVTALLRAGTDPDQDHLFGSVLYNKKERLLRAVIDAGVDLNRKTGWGAPQIFEALRWPEGLALMLEHGANTEAEDLNGRTAIMQAVIWEDWPAIDVLLSRGALIDHTGHDRESLRDFVPKQAKQIRDRHGVIPPQLAALAARLSIDLTRPQ